MDDRDSFDSGDATRVDLGEDLLEKTALIIREQASSTSSSAHEPTPESLHLKQIVTERESFVSSENPVELLQNARILINEGLLEEAKQTLRKVLIVTGTDPDAQALLSSIHDRELEQILTSEGSSRKRRSLRGNAEVPDWLTLPVSSDDVIRELEKDFGLLSEMKPDTEAEFLSNIESELQGGHPRDRIDLAIGVSEMGLARAAISLLRPLERDPEFALVAMTLKATLHLELSQSFEALMSAEQAISDPDLDDDQKAELSYLMGRAHEQIGNHEASHRWYQLAGDVRRGYRDSFERMKRLERWLK